MTKKNIIAEMLKREAAPITCAAHLAEAYLGQQAPVIPRDDEKLADALRDYRDAMLDALEFEARDYEPAARSFFAFVNADIDEAVAFVRRGGYSHIVNEQDERIFSIFA